MIGKEALTRLPRSAAAIETIVFNGLLLADLRFRPVAMYSTTAPGNRPRPESGDYHAELRDGSDRPLNREYVLVKAPIVCHGPPPDYSLLEGGIALRKDAAKFALFKRDILICEFSIGPAPKLSVRWDVRRASRRGRYDLRLAFSPPAPGAYVQVLYELAENHRVTLARMEPKPMLKIDFSSLPGGRRCRLVVAYTSGLRTVVRRTRFFSVPEQPRKGKSARSRLTRPRGPRAGRASA
jgi:hypothetical protein